SRFPLRSRPRRSIPSRSATRLTRSLRESSIWLAAAARRSSIPACAFSTASTISTTPRAASWACVGPAASHSRLAKSSCRQLDGAAPPPPAGSVPVVLDLEQRKRAQDVWRVCRRGGVQIGAVEIGKLADAEQTETALHLVLEELEQPHHAGLPAGGE